MDQKLSGTRGCGVYRVYFYGRKGACNGTIVSNYFKIIFVCDKITARLFDAGLLQIPVCCIVANTTVLNYNNIMKNTLKSWHFAVTRLLSRRPHFYATDLDANATCTLTRITVASDKWHLIVGSTLMIIIISCQINYRLQTGINSHDS